MKKNIFLSVIAGVYLLLFIYSLRFCYFWDVIQQISKEAFWYYKTNFSDSLLIHPLPGLEITPTGYHPPLITCITAVLWKIFGCYFVASYFPTKTVVACRGFNFSLRR
jgi:hypothetical protein